MLSARMGNALWPYGCGASTGSSTCDARSPPVYRVVVIGKGDGQMTGKSAFDTITLMRCPTGNLYAVHIDSTASSYVSPGTRRSGFSLDFRWQPFRNPRVTR